MKIILTCEHVGNEIPPEYKYLFASGESKLKSHRGYDPGALDLFNFLGNLADFKISHSLSRLLVELNRSPGHPQLFSEFTRDLSIIEKKILLDNFYYPYRNRVENTIAGFISDGEKVLHLSIHSFTPVLDKIERTADIGILYDPSRLQEKRFSTRIRENILNYYPGLRIRKNYPYLGKADGFTTYLRKKFPHKYSGIEVEINQAFCTNNIMNAELKNAVYNAFRSIQ